MTRIILLVVVVGLVLVLVLSGPANAAPAVPSDQVPGEPTPPMGIPKARPIPVGQRPQVTIQTATGREITIEKMYETPGLADLTLKPVARPDLVQTSTLKPGFNFSNLSAGPKVISSVGYVKAGAK